MKKIPTVFLFTGHQTWTSYRWITKKVQIWISCHDFWSFLSQDKTTSNYWSRAISSAAKCETNNREISLKLRFERELDLRSLTYTSESRVVGSELIGSITGEEGQNSLTEDLSMLPFSFSDDDNHIGFPLNEGNWIFNIMGLKCRELNTFSVGVKDWRNIVSGQNCPVASLQHYKLPSVSFLTGLHTIKSIH